VNKLKHQRDIGAAGRLLWGRSGMRVRILAIEADGSESGLTLKFKASPIALEVTEAYVEQRPGADEDVKDFALRCARLVDQRHSAIARAARDFQRRQAAARWQARRRIHGTRRSAR